MWRFRALLVACAICIHAAEDVVDQVHLALGRSSTEMVVSWAAYNNTPCFVDYAPNEAGLAEPWTAACERSKTYVVQADDMWNVDYSSPLLRHARLVGLEPASDYVYRIHGSEAVRAFATTAARGVDDYPLSMAVVGDIGQTAFSAVTIAELAANSPRPAACVLVGDLSYADGDGPRWDSWARLAEPAFAELPLMVLPGNHEIEFEQFTKAAFKGYRARHEMPGLPEEVAAGVYKSHYASDLTYDFGASFYSFDVGRTHWVMLNTYANSASDSLQYSWLQRDLACVDRELTPWVVVCMHAPWYNTNAKHPTQSETATRNHKANLERLVALGGASIVFAGHVHAYERSHPVCFGDVSSFAPTYVTIGDGGNRELLYNVWPDHVAAGWSAFRNGTRYGFGTLTFHNDSRAVWHWLPNEFEGPADEIWIDNLKPGGCGGGAAPDTGDCDAADAVAAVKRRAAQHRFGPGSGSAPSTGGGSAPFHLSPYGVAFIVCVGLATAFVGGAFLRARVVAARQQREEKSLVELEKMAASRDVWSQTSVHDDLLDDTYDDLVRGTLV